MSQYIDEYTVPTLQAAPLAITTDKHGFMWFTESNASKLGRFDPASNTFNEYNVPGVGDMWGLTVDRTGYVWLTQNSLKSNVGPGGIISPGGHGRLIRFDPVDHNFSVVAVPTNGSFPMRLAVDAENRVWFTELLGNKIGVYDQASKKLIEYALPTNSSGPADLTFDKHGTLWFTETYARQIGEFFPDNESFVEYPLTPATQSQYVASPVGLKIDEAGNVWFADHGGNWIGKFNPSSQQLVLYPTHSPRPDQYPTSIPNDIAIDSEGRIWFTEHGGNSIAYFDPASGTMVEFPIPTGPISTVLWLTLASDGNVWFAEYQTNKIGIVHTDLPIPLSLNTLPSAVDLQQGGEATLSLKINSSQTFTGNGAFRYSWATYNPEDIAVAFTPACSLPSAPGNFDCRVDLKLSKPVKSGSYMLGVGVDLGSILVWTMIQVQINEGQQTMPPVLSNEGQVYVLVIGIAALGLLAFVVVRHRRRKRA